MHKVLIINGPNLNLLGEKRKISMENFHLKILKKVAIHFLKTIILT